MSARMSFTESVDAICSRISSGKSTMLMAAIAEKDAMAATTMLENKPTYA